MKQNIFILSFLTLCLQACKAPMEYTSHQFDKSQSGRPVPYELARNLKSPGKMLLILPYNPDSINISSSPLAQEFFDEDYHILIPGKPGEDVFQMRNLHTKSSRISDVTGLLQDLDSLHNKELIILGMGEGAYITPQISRQASASRSILINAGIQSQLFELENIAHADSLLPRHEELFQRIGMDQEDLARRIKLIRENPNGSAQISPLSNRGWISYDEDPLINHLYGLQAPVLWINFKEHPLLSQQGLELVPRIARGIPAVTYKAIEGRGYLHKEEEIKSLLAEIEEFLNPH